MLPQDGEWRAPQSTSTAATRLIAGHFLTNSLQENHIVVEDPGGPGSGRNGAEEYDIDSQRGRDGYEGHRHLQTKYSKPPF